MLDYKTNTPGQAKLCKTLLKSSKGLISDETKTSKGWSQVLFVAFCGVRPMQCNEQQALESSTGPRLNKERLQAETIFLQCTMHTVQQINTFKR